MSAKMIVTLILTGLLVAFIVQNAQVAEVRFLFWSLAVSQSLLLFFVVAVGVLVGWVLHAYFAHKRIRRRSAEE